MILAFHRYRSRVHDVQNLVRGLSSDLFFVLFFILMRIGCLSRGLRIISDILNIFSIIRIIFLKSPKRIFYKITDLIRFHTKINIIH